MCSVDCRKKHVGIVVPDITAWTEALWFFGIGVVMTAHRIPVLWLFRQRGADVEFDLNPISIKKLRPLALSSLQTHRRRIGLSCAGRSI